MMHGNMNIKKNYNSTFKCDIPVVFYKFNMYSVQLAVKTQLIYCTVLYCTVLYCTVLSPQ